VKSRLYAKAGIPEYWLVIVTSRSIEVFRDPDPKLGTYNSRVTLTEPETLVPMASRDSPFRSRRSSTD
jgi:Uma2 family endonuclease